MEIIRQCFEKYVNEFSFKRRSSHLQTAVFMLTPDGGIIPYFPGGKMPVIFSLGVLEKMMTILISVNYWKKTGLLHTKISNHNMMPDLMIWKQISLSHNKDV
jgi:hypothetical protein